MLSAIKRAITRFDQAAQDYAFVGAADPRDFAGIEDEYQRSRELLENLIEKVMKEARHDLSSR